MEGRDGTCDHFIRLASDNEELQWRFENNSDNWFWPFITKGKQSPDEVPTDKSWKECESSGDLPALIYKNVEDRMHVNVVRELLQFKADILQQNSRKRTPLLSPQSVISGSTAQVSETFQKRRRERASRDPCKARLPSPPSLQGIPGEVAEAGPESRRNRSRVLLSLARAAKVGRWVASGNHSRNLRGIHDGLMLPGLSFQDVFSGAQHTGHTSFRDSVNKDGR